MKVFDFFARNCARNNTVRLRTTVFAHVRRTNDVRLLLFAAMRILMIVYQANKINTLIYINTVH